jgi:hypothetical protein
MDQNELVVGPHHQGVPLGSSKMIFEPMVRLAQTVHLSCIQTDRNEIPHDPRHVGVPSDASKTIFEPMVRSVHTVHLSCIKISTISKQNEMSFQLSLVTVGYFKRKQINPQAHGYQNSFHLGVVQGIDFPWGTRSALVEV